MRVSTVLLLFLMGCGSQPTVQITSTPAEAATGNNIPASVQAIVDKFVRVATYENYTPIGVTNLTVAFTAGDIPTCGTTVEPDVVGCATWDTVNQKIQLSQAYWNSADSGSQEALVFHEMGHAFLNRVHRPTLNNTLPLSIMHASVLVNPTYGINLAQYYYELFNQTDLQSSLPLQLTGTAPANLLNL